MSTVRLAVPRGGTPDRSHRAGTVTPVSKLDQATRVARRCETHPRRQAEYSCESCGRALCLTCAVPVRGKVLGLECVRVPTGAEPDGSRGSPRRAAFLAAGVGFCVSLAGTFLPWSAPNFSHYTGPFGGWGFSPVAWSLAAAAAAVVGLGAWAVEARGASLSPALAWTVP